jgi:hypothetical protein
MKTQYLATGLLAICTLAFGIIANSFYAGESCPSPSARSVTALFAPCQTLDNAVGNSASKQASVHMGVLVPNLQPLPATQEAQNRNLD